MNILYIILLSYLAISLYFFIDIILQPKFKGSLIKQTINKTISFKIGYTLIMLFVSTIVAMLWPVYKQLNIKY